MKKLTIRLKTVTPLFLSGADHESNPDLRSPSIKGALRFWFRVIYSAYTRDEESAIFGSTDRQSGILIRVTDVKLEIGNKGDEFDNKTKLIIFNISEHNGLLRHLLRHHGKQTPPTGGQIA